jgi:hypothetical protein
MSLAILTLKLGSLSLMQSPWLTKASAVQTSAGIAPTSARRIVGKVEFAPEIQT